MTDKSSDPWYCSRMFDHEGCRCTKQKGCKYRSVENPEYRYGKWSGNPNGMAQDPRRCVAEVWGDYIVHQCARKRPEDSLYCWQHEKVDA